MDRRPPSNPVNSNKGIPRTLLHSTPQRSHRVLFRVILANSKEPVNQLPGVHSHIFSVLWDLLLWKLRFFRLFVVGIDSSHTVLPIHSGVVEHDKDVLQQSVQMRSWTFLVTNSLEVLP